MKYSITAGIIAATIATSAFAETPAQNASQITEAAATGPKHDFMRNRMEKMWKEMDTNGDGVISKEESTAFGNKKFDEKDSNHDGKVTRDEWDAFHNAKMEEFKEKHGMKEGAKPGSAHAPADKK